MRTLLIAINGIAVALLAAYITLATLYASYGAPDRGMTTILVFALPSIMTIAAAVIRISRAITVVALATNGLFFLVLLLLAAGAVTGIGGAFGLLFVILPAELLLGINSFSLINGLRSQCANTLLPADAPRQ
ncbi:MAG: hypothetical protein JWR25_797 [Noviherbaspirillum sp.]|nr:hypothetical protein [Noviherbaspirillum sp.]